MSLPKSFPKNILVCHDLLTLGSTPSEAASMIRNLSGIFGFDGVWLKAHDGATEGVPDLVASGAQVDSAMASFFQQVRNVAPMLTTAGIQVLLYGYNRWTDPQAEADLAASAIRDVPDCAGYACDAEDPTSNKQWACGYFMKALRTSFSALMLGHMPVVNVDYPAGYPCWDAWVGWDFIAPQVYWTNWNQSPVEAMANASSAIIYRHKWSKAVIPIGLAPDGSTVTPDATKQFANAWGGSSVAWWVGDKLVSIYRTTPVLTFQKDTVTATPTAQAPNIEQLQAENLALRGRLAAIQQAMEGYR